VEILPNGMFRYAARFRNQPTPTAADLTLTNINIGTVATMPIVIQ
jgi:hypothetical protein